MLKKLPRKKSFYIVTFVLLLALVLCIRDYKFFGYSLAILTVPIALWRHLASERSSQEQESIYGIQHRLMAEGGLGNVYVESIKEEMTKPQSAWPLDITSKLDKALSIEPNNQFAMVYDAVNRSMQLSELAAMGFPVQLSHADDVKKVRQFCIRGRKLYPKEPLFCDAMGMLCDALRNHKSARTWFRKGAKIDARLIPFLQLRVATSNSIEGNFSAALVQLEQAKAAGMSNWALNRMLGIIYCSLGRYGEAMSHLRLAHHERRLRDDIVHWMGITQKAQMHLYRASYYDFMSILLLMLYMPGRGLFRLMLFPVYLLSVSYRLTCRRLYLLITTFWPASAKRIGKWLNPEMLSVDFATPMFDSRNYVCAENICRIGLRYVPDSINLLNNLGWSLRAQGKVEEAKNVFDKALILYPKNEILLHNRESLHHPYSGTTWQIDASFKGDTTR
jgi:tetratricopeptide (TPR) repeat protein